MIGCGVNQDGIPQELKARPQWVLRRGKVPFQVSGVPAKADDPTTWANFETVWAAYQAGGFDGIGFEFSEDCPYVGIDLDGCRDPETGTVEPWAVEVIEKFPGAYQEISLSGTGIHLILKGTLPIRETGKRKKLSAGEDGRKDRCVEAYHYGRFFAMTGDSCGEPVEEIMYANGELSRWFKVTFPDEPKPVAVPLGSRYSGDRLKLLERAKKYLEKAEPAVEGQGGDDWTFHVCCILVCRFGLTEAEAWDVVQEWNARCSPPWDEYHLKRKISEAAKQPITGDLAAGRERGEYRGGNTFAEFCRSDAGETTLQNKGDTNRPIGLLNIGASNLVRNADVIGAGKDRETIPVPMTDILATIRQVTGDSIMRIGGSLFIHEKPDPPHFLETPSATMGFIGSKAGHPPKFHSAAGCHPRDDVYQELRRSVRAFDGIEMFPHVPRMADRYYACDFPKAGDGSKLERLLDFFNPETPADRDLLKALFVTPLWGGDGKVRNSPAFGLTAPKVGRGAGKTTVMTAAGLLYGGILSVSLGENTKELKDRLLSPDGRKQRLGGLDNIKTHRASWAAFESLLTSPVISGRQMFVGEATRANNLTWLMSVNGACLSTDMAQRTVMIHLAKPTYSATWEEDLRRFILTHQWEIIGDIIGVLEGPKRLPARFSRWGLWEADVLSTLSDPTDAQALILERQQGTDVEAEESEVVEEYFADRLAEVGYDIDAEKVFIPSPIACEWYCKSVNEKVGTIAVGRILGQMADEGKLVRLQRSNSRGRFGRGVMWVGESWDGRTAANADLETRITHNREGRSWPSAGQM